MKRSSRALALLPLALLTATLAACSSAAPAAETDASAASIGDVDLSADCPATVVVQTNWNPEAEHGPLYQLVGPDPVIDAQNKWVTGPLYDGDEYTGVDIEVRAGGPAIGYQTVASQLYTDPDILLGYVEITEAVQNSAELPTTAVFAQFDKDPGAVIWDPATYPDVTDIADLGAEGVTLLTSDGAIGSQWLIDSGIYPADLIDRSYDGTPATFSAAGGTIAQTGYATAEPFIYENEVEAWGKPLAFQLIADAGWPNYSNTLSMRSDAVDANAACLEKLVPVVQRAELAYFDDPSDTNALLVDLVDQYDTGWVYGAEVADYAAAEMPELGLVGDGDNDYIGDFDEKRVADAIAIVSPILQSTGGEVAPGLTPDDLFTNEFLDESIGFGE